MTELRDGDSTDLDALLPERDGRPQRNGETERRLLDAQPFGAGSIPHILAWESTYVDQTGASQQAVEGFVATEGGSVVEFEARGIGLATVREILSGAVVT